MTSSGTVQNRRLEIISVVGYIIINISPKSKAVMSFTRPTSFSHTLDERESAFAASLYTCIFFFYVPSLSMGLTILVRFLRMSPFLNPTIEVVTFHLRGSCMLGVFLSPTFTRLGHESQDLLSPCDGIHVCRLDLGLYSYLNKFGGMESEPMLSSREKSPPPEGRTSNAASRRTESPTRWRRSYSGPVHLYDSVIRLVRIRLGEPCMIQSSD